MHKRYESALKFAILITTLFFGVEIFGGLLSGSLSLLGDAGHMLRDVLALAMSLLAITLAKKTPCKVKTFGYHRLEILAALLNGIFLLAMSAWIGIEAIHRIREPYAIEGSTMFVVALAGLFVNAYVALELHGSHDVNIRSAFLHVLTDLLSSIAVVIASVWISLTGQTIVDPLLSIAIAIIILASSITIIKDSLRVLLEFAPKNVNLELLLAALEAHQGVESVHDLRVWSVCSNVNMLSAHIYTKERDLSRIESMKRSLKRVLEHFHIKHSTLEFECQECADNGKVRHLHH